MLVIEYLLYIAEKNGYNIKNTTMMTYKNVRIKTIQAGCIK